jgi:osmoprotectant transport system permease protein
MSYLATHPTRVLALTGQHLEVVLVALAVACAIALPLAVAAFRNPRLGVPLLALLGAVYTIPSLALLALLVEAIGLGPAPIFVALVAYAQFMLVRNIVAGLRGVDPAQRDAAYGMGMTPRRALWTVEIPLALPIIVGGVRIAAIAMVALATLGGYVGSGGLGTLIFIGLTLQHSDEIVAGAIATSLLAIAIDLVLRLAERAVSAQVGGR